MCQPFWRETDVWFPADDPALLPAPMRLLVRRAMAACSSGGAAVRMPRGQWSTACGGGDAVVGGVEQCRGGIASGHQGPYGPPGWRATPVGRPRSALGG